MTSETPKTWSIFPESWDEDNRTETSKKYSMPTTQRMKEMTLEKGVPNGLTLEEWSAMLDWSADMGRRMRTGEGMLPIYEWVDRLDNPDPFLIKWADKVRPKDD